MECKTLNQGTSGSKRNICMECDYTWIQRKTNPKKCPGCQSAHWASGKAPTWVQVAPSNEPEQFKKCQKCSYSWTPRTANPKKCPNCGSAHWNYIRRAKFESQEIDSEHPSAQEPNSASASESMHAPEPALPKGLLYPFKREE